MSKKGGHPVDEFVHKDFTPEVYDLSTLDDIQAGRVVDNNVDDELELGSLNKASDSWDPASLLHLHSF